MPRPSRAQRVCTDCGSGGRRNGARAHVRSTEDRCPADGELIAIAEVAKCAERRFHILIVTQRKRIEAALVEIVELIAQDITDRAQLAGELVTIAQESARGVAASIAERRKIDGDEGEGAR